MAEQVTKIDIFSGFLGAGKTTLIKKLIAEAYSGEKLVLIENEFGEINIDGGFLKESGIEISEMSAGCICCSLVGDFNKALKEVVAQFHPDRILIEPSGVGKLSDVTKAVMGVAAHEQVELNSSVTVVDGQKCKMFMKNFGEFFNNQIESANTIILSRTQTTTQDKIEKAVAMIREKNDHATIITTPWDEIDGAAIREAMQNYKSLEETMMDEAKKGHDHDHDHGDECTCGCHDHDHHHDHDDDHEHHHDHEHEHHHDHEHDHHHHHADDVFTSWGTETPKKYEKAELDSILKKLSESEDYGKVLRSKGMLPCTDGTWMYFDLVPEEYEIREGSADFTGRICVIGSELKEDALKELFEV